MIPVNLMTASDPLRLDAVLLDLRARTKMDVLAALAARAGEITGCDPRAVVRALTDRERLGSTGVGAGVALPHAEIHGLDRPISLFARLAEPIDWEAIDDQWRGSSEPVGQVRPSPAKRRSAASPRDLSGCGSSVRDPCRRRLIRPHRIQDVVGLEDTASKMAIL